jgi:hypothetical protein
MNKIKFKIYCKIKILKFTGIYLLKIYSQSNKKKWLY